MILDGGGWTTAEQLLLVHAILKCQRTFVAVARSIRQTSSVAILLSHKRSFFTPKVPFVRFLFLYILY